MGGGANAVMTDEGHMVSPNYYYWSHLEELFSNLQQNDYILIHDHSGTTDTFTYFDDKNDNGDTKNNNNTNAIIVILMLASMVFAPAIAQVCFLLPTAIATHMANVNLMSSRRSRNSQTALRTTMSSG